MNVHETVRDNAAFAGYTSTLAFLLVFRTSQCYSRFWHCATSACTFRAQLLEAASSLISFPLISKHPIEEVDLFRSCVVTYTSLLHAAALGHVSACSFKVFPVINYSSIPEKHRERLEKHTLRQRVDLVYMWMNGIIVLNIGNGLLNIPPPIMSRVFQEMEKGMIEYNQILEVMLIPFPFPYAQCAIVLLCLVGVSTPIAMCSWTDHALTAGALCFVVIVCLVSIECISRELENPFGEDPNDLPIEDFQNTLNESLMLMVSDYAQDFPHYEFKPPERKGADAVGSLMDTQQSIQVAEKKRGSSKQKEIGFQTLPLPYP